MEYKMFKIVLIYENKLLILLEIFYFLLSEAKWKTRYGSGLKILILKRIFQGLPIALAQVKAGNRSEKILIEIRKIIYFLYRRKKLWKKI